MATIDVAGETVTVVGTTDTYTWKIDSNLSDEQISDRINSMVKHSDWVLPTPVSPIVFLDESAAKAKLTELGFTVT